MFNAPSSLRIMPVFRTGEDGALPSERSCPPTETIERIWPYLPAFGITRLARQTDLDRVGISCWAAFRPNSKSLASAQGKGLDDAAACASAAMEAIEVAVAECPRCRSKVTSASELAGFGEDWLDPERLLPFGTAFDHNSVITWFLGTDLLTRTPIWVPSDTVDLDGERSELKGICKSSNGLASGNTEDEALFHGLCELVERDATTLWTLRPQIASRMTCFSPETLGDPTVNQLAQQIASSGLKLRLFDLTTDLGIAVVMAIVGPDEQSVVGELELAAGYGAHPIAARAAVRAITEAAQSRITSIAASRDDIHSASFGSTAGIDASSLIMAEPLAPAPLSSAAGTTLPDLIGRVLSALAARRCRTIAVRLETGGAPFHVVKILSPDLEDRDANINWRPGWRSFDAVATH